ncbi:type I restriction-modification system subunit M N-terminal domain-containing protein [Halomonas jincaotanensis]|uniref:type I restriction-modification system subunit M N-terminal domain-containing protein n=1 Tax=Halomonas jincaotanensis TaxID=2810616 RepID=UPI0029E800E3|nr:type I restriction-modification system subunit M N-terminal domain-containing protein [Halomonas jincaotanensis]
MLRVDFKQSQYGRIILPFTLLRRLESVLEFTKAAMLAAAQEHQAKPNGGLKDPGRFAPGITGKPRVRGWLPPVGVSVANEATQTEAV